MKERIIAVLVLVLAAWALTGATITATGTTTTQGGEGYVIIQFSDDLSADSAFAGTFTMMDPQVINAQITSLNLYGWIEMPTGDSLTVVLANARTANPSLWDTVQTATPIGGDAGVKAAIEAQETDGSFMPVWRVSGTNHSGGTVSAPWRLYLGYMREAR